MIMNAKTDIKGCKIQTNDKIPGNQKISEIVKNENHTYAHSSVQWICSISSNKLRVA